MKTIIVTTMIPRPGDRPEKVSCNVDVPQFENLDEVLNTASDCDAEILDIVNTHLITRHANMFRGKFRG